MAHIIPAKAEGQFLAPFGLLKAVPFRPSYLDPLMALVRQHQGLKAKTGDR